MIFLKEKRNKKESRIAESVSVYGKTTGSNFFFIRLASSLLLSKCNLNGLNESPVTEENVLPLVRTSFILRVPFCFYIHVPVPQISFKQWQYFNEWKGLVNDFFFCHYPPLSVVMLSQLFINCTCTTLDDIICFIQTSGKQKEEHKIKTVMALLH